MSNSNPAFPLADDAPNQRFYQDTEDTDSDPSA